MDKLKLTYGAPALTGTALMSQLKNEARPSGRANELPAAGSFITRLAVAQKQYMPLLATPSMPLQVSTKPLLPTTSQPVAKNPIPLNERALSLHQYRLELLASNMANADTPGYQAVDFDLEQALRKGQSVAAKNIPLLYHVPSQAAIDGNTVEMDVERNKFADSAVRYEYTVDRVKGRYAEISRLLGNTPY